MIQRLELDRDHEAVDLKLRSFPAVAGVPHPNSPASKSGKLSRRGGSLYHFRQCSGKFAALAMTGVGQMLGLTVRRRGRRTPVVLWFLLRLVET